MNKTHLYTVGGTIPPEHIYIERQADEELLALCRAGTLGYVLTTRQVGKSSLMVRTALKLEAEGTRCVLADLSLLGSQFDDAKWYLGLLLMIEDELELMSDTSKWWEDHAELSETHRLVNFFQKVVLEEIKAPIVIFLDEIDSTLNLPASADFFAAIRALYNARARVAALKRLTFVLIGVATPSDLIDDPKRTPFNIGQRVELTDFTLDEAAPLAEGLVSNHQANGTEGVSQEAKALQLLAWSLKWTGGHPYLTQRLCVVLLQEPQPVTEESELSKVVDRTFFGEKALQDHNLQFVRRMLTELAPNKQRVLDMYRQIRLWGRVDDDPQSMILNHLKLSGVVRVEDNKLRVRNPIYEEVFDTQWIKEQWPLNHEKLYTIGGTIMGRLYIERQADEELLALCRAGTFAYMLAARQMGKSSLMVQTAHKLAAEGRYCVKVDLSTLGSQFEGAEWYLGLLQMINDALKLMSDMRSWWEQQAHLSGTQRLVNFFKEIVVLSESPIVIFLDEIDSTFSLPVTADFFAAIRALYNERTQVAALKRLTFVLIGVAAPCDLINDPKRTPFNIGQRVELTDFTLDEALPLAEGLSLPAEQTQLVLTCLLKWTGGHPYLTQRLCVALLQEPAQLSQFERDTREAEAAVDRVVKRTFFGSKSEEDNHLQFVRDMLTKRAPDKIAVLSTYRDIREGRTVRHDAQSQIQSHLKLSGIVWREGNKLRVRNPIYEEVFNQKWIEEQWPLNWWQTLPKSVKIAAVMMVVMFVALLLSLGFAIKQQQLAAERAIEAQEAAHQERLARAEAEEAAHKEKEARGEAEEAARKESQARSEAERQSALALSQAKASEALFELSHNQIERVLLLTLASVSYDTTNYPIIASRVLRDTVEETKSLLQVLHHSDVVKSAEWNPDGLQVLTSSWDDKARIWDATTGELLLSLGHKEDWGFEEPSASWSPDGQQVLTKNTEGEEHIWSQKGQLLQTKGFSIHLTFVSNVDGQQMLISKHENSIQMTSQERSQSVATDLFWHKLVIWNPDGTVVLTSIHDRWRRIEELLYTWNDVSITLASWSPDGTVVLTSSNDGWVRIWSKKGQLLHTLTKPLDMSIKPFPVAWSPDGQQVAIVSSGEVQIWEVSTGQLLTTLEQNSSPVSSVALGPNGLRVLTGHSDGTLQAWSQEGQLLLSFTAHSSSVLEVAWDPDGQQLLTHDGSTVRIWDATSPLVWSPNGDLGLTMSKDGSTQIRQTATGQLLSTLPVLLDEIREIVWSTDGQQVVTMSKDGSTQIWQTAGGELLDTLPVNSNEIMSFQWDNEGIWIATVTQDDHIFHRARYKTDVPQTSSWPVFNKLQHYNCQREVWDPATGQSLHLFNKLSGCIIDVAWSPDGQAVLIGNYKTAQIWEANTGQLLHTLDGHSGDVTSVAWSPDGQKVLTGSEDNTARIWDATTGDLLSILAGHSDDIYDVRWTSDGQQVLTKSSDGTERIWIVDESLLMARLTEVVCMVWGHDEEAIRAEVPNWRGCEVELVEVADDLAKYKALRGP